MFDYALKGALKPRFWTCLVVLTVKVQRSLAFPNPTPAFIRPRATWQIDLLYCGTENQDNTLSQIPRKTRKQVSSLSFNMPHVLSVFRTYLQTKNGILLPKLFWPAVRKNCPGDREKLLKFEAEGPRVCKIFETTRTIYSNSERSEQFLW